MLILMINPVVSIHLLSRVNEAREHSGVHSHKVNS